LPPCGKTRGVSKAFAASKGFCLEHYGQLLEYAAKHMTGANQRAFIAVLVEVERAAVCRIEKELEWYTLKFDYRNRDKLGAIRATRWSAQCSNCVPIKATGRGNKRMKSMTVKKVAGRESLFGREVAPLP
jgi:hypothetical protein